MTPTCGHTGGHIVPVGLRERFGLDPLPDVCLAAGGCAHPDTYPIDRQLLERMIAARTERLADAEGSPLP